MASTELPNGKRKRHEEIEDSTPPAKRLRNSKPILPPPPRSSRQTRARAKSAAPAASSQSRSVSVSAESGINHASSPDVPRVDPQDSVTDSHTSSQSPPTTKAKSRKRKSDEIEDEPEVNQVSISAVPAQYAEGDANQSRALSGSPPPSQPKSKKRKIESFELVARLEALTNGEIGHNDSSSSKVISSVEADLLGEEAAEDDNDEEQGTAADEEEKAGRGGHQAGEVEGDDGYNANRNIMESGVDQSDAVVNKPVKRVGRPLKKDARKTKKGKGKKNGVMDGRVTKGPYQSKRAQVTSERQEELKKQFRRVTTITKNALHKLVCMDLARHVEDEDFFKRLPEFQKILGGLDSRRDEAVAREFQISEYKREAARRMWEAEKEYTILQAKYEFEDAKDRAINGSMTATMDVFRQAKMNKDNHASVVPDETHYRTAFPDIERDPITFEPKPKLLKVRADEIRARAVLNSRRAATPDEADEEQNSRPNRDETPDEVDEDQPEQDTEQPELSDSGELSETNEATRGTATRGRGRGRGRGGGGGQARGGLTQPAPPLATKKGLLRSREQPVKIFGDPPAPDEKRFLYANGKEYDSVAYPKYVKSWRSVALDGAWNRFVMLPHFKFTEDTVGTDVMTNLSHAPTSAPNGDIGIRNGWHAESNEKEPPLNPPVFYYDHAIGDNPRDPSEFDTTLIKQFDLHPQLGRCWPGCKNPDGLVPPTDYANLPRTRPIVFVKESENGKVIVSETSRSARYVHAEQDWDEFWRMFDLKKKIEGYCDAKTLFTETGELATYDSVARELANKGKGLDDLLEAAKMVEEQLTELNEAGPVVEERPVGEESALPAADSSILIDQDEAPICDAFMKKVQGQAPRGTLEELAELASMVSTSVQSSDPDPTHPPPAQATSQRTGSELSIAPPVPASPTESTFRHTEPSSSSVPALVAPPAAQRSEAPSQPPHPLPEVTQDKLVAPAETSSSNLTSTARGSVEPSAPASQISSEKESTHLANQPSAESPQPKEIVSQGSHPSSETLPSLQEVNIIRKYAPPVSEQSSNTPPAPQPQAPYHPPAQQPVYSAGNPPSTMSRNQYAPSPLSREVAHGRPHRSLAPVAVPSAPSPQAPQQYWQSIGQMLNQKQREFSAPQPARPPPPPISQPLPIAARPVRPAPPSSGSGLRNLLPAPNANTPPPRPMYYESTLPHISPYPGPPPLQPASPGYGYPSRAIPPPPPQYQQYHPTQQGSPTAWHYAGYGYQTPWEQAPMYHFQSFDVRRPTVPLTLAPNLPPLRPAGPGGGQQPPYPDSPYGPRYTGPYGPGRP